MKKILTGLLVMLSLSVFAKDQIVLIKTTMGDIEIQLYEKEAPISVKNFLKYVDAKKYDGTIFHRVIDGFMIQGGGFTPKMEKVEGYAPIQNEATNGLMNTTGTVAMARTQDVNSATNQFFINVNDNNFLNHRSKDARNFGYAVFGRIVKGMSVVNRIKKVKTGNHGYYQNVPVSPIVITKVMRK